MSQSVITDAKCKGWAKGNPKKYKTVFSSQQEFFLKDLLKYWAKRIKAIFFGCTFQVSGGQSEASARRRWKMRMYRMHTISLAFWSPATTNISLSHSKCWKLFIVLLWFWCYFLIIGFLTNLQNVCRLVQNLWSGSEFRVVKISQKAVELK